MYEQVRTNNQKYDGLFFTCVKTTGIFCLPSCKARLPLEQNVEFVSSVQEALERGYRPCKRCCPTQDPYYSPDWLPVLKEYLDRNLDRRIPEYEISQLVGQDITTVRRHFRERYHMSLKNYHRVARLQQAKKLMAEGLNLNQIAGMVGYVSLKGFRNAFRNQFGVVNGLE